MKTPAKAIKKVAEKQKASASEKKNKSLIKVSSATSTDWDPDPDPEDPIIRLLSKRELRMARNLMRRNKGMDLQGAVIKLGIFE